MPDPETLLRAAGVVKVVEQTWRLDPQGPTGNSSARIGERPRIEPGAVQQAREGEAWYIARGRFEHLMVARTTRSATATGHARTPWSPWPGPGGPLRSSRVLAPGSRRKRPARSTLSRPAAGSWPSSRHPTASGTDLPPEPHGPAPAGHRLRLAVAAAARDGDQDATATLVRQGPRPRRRGEPSWWRWPRPTGPSPACTVAPGGPDGRWTTTRLRRLHRPRGRAALAEPEHRP